jgi:micrococcal nuclease
LLDPRLLPAIAIAAACAIGPAIACDGLAEGPGGVVSKVFDGRTVELDSGIVVRLSGLRTPVPVGRAAVVPAEPLADAATAALGKLVLNRPVRLGLDDEETDRYGHMEAQLFIDMPDGAWVQQAMLGNGMARVEVLPKGRKCMAELITAEAVARGNGVGIWADPYYRVRDAGNPAALLERTGKYELIEGDVVGTGEARGRVYLDFGRVWKDDLTATIDQKARGLFAAAGIDLLSLKGQRVRLRGWIEDHDGPLVELGEPEQLEVLATK